MSTRTLGNAARGQMTGASDMQDALAPATKAFNITAVGQQFFVPMNGRSSMRAQLGSADGRAIVLGTLSVDVDLTLAPYRPGRGTYNGEGIPPPVLAADWVSGGAAITQTALGTFITVTGPANLARFTVNALTGLTSGNLQLWVL